MALDPGNRLGPYEILSPLGAGGMGEVYKARDIRLARTVAVKILSGDVAVDPDVRARFEREARAIAALSHPNICTVHDVGREPVAGAGPEIDFIVMEYLDGESLADRIARSGSLPIGQVLSVGIAIADALDKAHRAGLVHRDIKPANVMLTKSGPKLLDFGLAKTRTPAAQSLDVTRGAGSQQAEPTRALTGAHTVIGTIHYMAPEQVEGREADTRSDIWALGAVLYEMSTGQRPFAGDSAAGVMSAILKDAVPLVSARQSLAPASFDHLVDRCLQKDPDERWQDAGDVKRQLQWIASAQSGTQAAPALSPPRRTTARPWVAVACLVAGLALGALAMFVRPEAPPPVEPRTFLSMALPENVRPGGAFALSPDGRYFVFVGLGDEGPPMLWLRSLDSTTTRPLEGTEDASYPFWSPRGDAIGFFAGGRLKTIDIAGGTPRTIATAANGRGGAWGEDGTILFSAQVTGILRVSERGGDVTPVTSFAPQDGVTGHRWPTFVSPRHFVYAVQGSDDVMGIYFGSLEGSQTTKLNGIYSNALFAGGQLLFVADGMLVGQSLDIEARRLIGTPQEVVGPVTSNRGLGYSPVSASLTGMLAYTAGGTASSSAVVWLDRQGTRLGPLVADAAFNQDTAYNGRLSRDGRTVVLSTFRSSTADLWLVDLERGVPSRFTFDDANDQMPMFSPDGTEVLFASNRSGPYNLYRKPVSGSSEETRLFESATSHYPTDWSAQASVILFTNLDPKTQLDIWMVPSGTNVPPTPLLATGFNEYGARVSPDGRWIAYTSDESGRREVYVQRFPELAGKRQISNAGGTQPTWRADGRELFYLAANQTIMAVPVTSGTEFSAGQPVQLSDAVIETNLGSGNAVHYTPTADGQSFLANVSTVSTTAPTIVLNWASREAQ